MKKYVLPLCLALAAPTAANADMILGIYAGAGSWQPSATGTISNTTPLDVETELGVEDDSNTVLYAALEHPVPLVPNIKIQQTNMSVSGSSTSTGYAFGGTTFAIGDTVNTTIDLSHIDSTLYYEILDNIVSADIGITVRKFDGSYELVGTSAGTATAVMDKTRYLVYAMAQVDIPITGLSVGAEVQKSIAYNDDEIQDIKLRIGYEFAFGLGLELGKRTMTMTLKEAGPVQTQDLELDGTYISATFHF